ncbi:MAG TPA: hypothetical protein VNN12_04595 [Dehalococcoidia bacterium]|nr:hypothetical protein [Dehalococcoidia bacterium]
MRRIAVFGPSGSGKTTVSREIGRILGLPVIELDALYHRPNWQPTPPDEFRRKVQRALSGRAAGWVCDGNYSVVRPLVLARADTVVWLRLPFPLVYLRLFRRTVVRAWRKETLWGTNRESWRQSFFSRDSILLWGVTHWRAHFRGVARDLDDMGNGARVIELRSHDDVERFLRGLETPRDSARGAGRPAMTNRRSD